MKNKTIFYVIILVSAMTGYFISYGIQCYVTNTLKDNLFSIKSFEMHTYTIKNIEKRTELNIKSKLTKNDYIITFEESKQKFRTYSIPYTNPDGFYFQKYFNEDLQIGNRVYVYQIIPKLVSDISDIPIIGMLLEKDYTLLIDIFPSNKLHESKYYNREFAYNAFCKIDVIYQILCIVIFIIIGVSIYYMKFYHT